jgi:hypothetical protein
MSAKGNSLARVDAAILSRAHKNRGASAVSVRIHSISAQRRLKQADIVHPYQNVAI